MSKIGPDTRLSTLQRIAGEFVHRDWGSLVNNVRQSMRAAGYDVTDAEVRASVARVFRVAAAIDSIDKCIVEDADLLARLAEGESEP